MTHNRLTLHGYVRRYITSFPLLTDSLRALLEILANSAAHIAGFSFPKKFGWAWKIEMLTKNYEHETYALLRTLIRPGMHVVDIGAHIGYFSRLFAKQVGRQGRVYCFEADPENFSLLKKNTEGRGTVHLFNTAIADREGVIDFYHVDNSTGCHSIIQPNAAAKKIRVPVRTIDQMMHEGLITRVDVMKMDIEGGEPRALAGMKSLLKSTQHLALIVEFNPASLELGGTTASSFITSLMDVGFTISGITAGGLHPVNDSDDARRLAENTRTGSINLYCKKYMV